MTSWPGHMSLVILHKLGLINFEGVSDKVPKMNTDFATRGLSLPFCFLVTSNQDGRFHL